MNFAADRRKTEKISSRLIYHLNNRRKKNRTYKVIKRSDERITESGYGKCVQPGNAAMQKSVITHTLKYYAKTVSRSA